MLRDLNEYLTLITLVLISITALGYGIGAVFSGENDGTFFNNLEMFLNYDDNEEE